MKNIVKFVCLAWLFVAGCTKEDKLVVLEGGTAPVLSANVSTPLYLKKKKNVMMPLSFHGQIRITP